MTTIAPIRSPEDDLGLIGSTLRRVFGRNYRTTVPGLLGFFGQGAYIAFQVSQGHLPLEQAIPLALGMMTSAGLVAAKDAKVSGLPR